VRSLRTAPSGGRPVCRLAPSAQIVPAKPSPVHALLIRMFDLLQLGEKDYRPEPLKVRRETLEKLVKGQTLILPARRLSPNGLAAWAEVLHRGYEGMVAKDPEAPYAAGRTLEWLKVKVRNYRVKERAWE
jgi:ATP-dependent DNA ligase